VSAYAYLDFGPTTDHSVNARPSTDNKVSFEDLVVLALDYGVGSALTYRGPAPRMATGAVPASADELVLATQQHAVAGQEVVVSLTFLGTGRVQAFSAHLSWDPAIVEPISMTPADWIEGQGGMVLSPQPGTVDVAKLGASGSGLAGTGEIATVTFRTIASGDPRIKIDSIDARDASNNSVPVTGSETVPTQFPTVTALALAAPNPFSTTSTLAFTLAQGGPVELSIHSVDGRRVRTLVHETREPGSYRIVWDGRDDRGERVLPGMYYVRFTTPRVRASRSLVYLK
jgi:hypothetical protein